MAEERLQGEVMSYGDDRGFGFIRTADGTDYFVRFNEIQMDGYRTLKQGQRVTFIPHTVPPTGDLQAWEVRVEGQEAPRRAPQDPPGQHNDAIW